MEILGNMIDGVLQGAMSGETLENVEPATGHALGRVPDSDGRDVDLAVAAAQRALPGWRALGAQGRSDALRKLADGIEARLDPWAEAESRDTGKPVALARRLDIPRAAANFRFFADAATQTASEAHITDDAAVNYTTRKALGTVACISPWNLPLYLLTWKIAPALAAGNCVVAKPSEVTPLTAHLLAQLCIDTGLPPGVLNIVHGTGSKIGAPLCTHPDIKAVSFTGSTRTGGQIATLCAPLFKKLSLEMGGKNATVVFDDAEFEHAVDTTLRAAFSNQGQICLCGSRILVQRGIYDRFVAALADRAHALAPGDPQEESTVQGALVSEAHFDKVMQYLALAREEGGAFAAGGKPVKLPGRCAGGHFIPPTLITGLGADARTNQEEIFGPVATIMPFDDEAEALTWANGTVYGLAASVFTRDIGRAHRFADRLQAGLVWINCWMMRDLRTPFGGVKSSGVGREGGLEALRFFTEPKNVCLNMEP